MGFVSNILGVNDPEVPDFSGQDAAAREANALQERIYEESVARGEPFVQVGADSIGRLGELLGVSGNADAEGFGSLVGGPDLTNFETDPGYQFRLDEGQKAIERSAAARGGLYSPSTSKDLQRFGQNLASAEYNAIYGREAGVQADLFNRLSGLAGSGQTQSAAQTAAGQNFANTVGETNIGLEQARTSAELATQNARDSRFNTIIGAAASAAAAAGGGGAGSDRRIKENIVEVGEKNGHKLYEFNYIFDKTKRYRGVMAQDLLETMPEAVIDNGGVYFVDYSKLGFDMEEVK